MDSGWLQPLNDVAPNVSQAVTTHGRFFWIFWGLKYTWCFFFNALTTSRGMPYYKPPKPQDGLDTNPNPTCFVQSCTPENLNFAWESVFKVCFRVLLVLPPWFISRRMNILTVVTLVGFYCWVKLLEGSWMHTINNVCTTMQRLSKHAERCVDRMKQPNCCGHIDMLVDWYCVTYYTKLYRHVYRYNQKIYICLYLHTCISWKRIINIPLKWTLLWWVEPVLNDQFSQRRGLIWVQL